MLRLTLRTLLAYLDDTLDPAEIKTIGQKLAESPPAQELVARIKAVTRKRRLGTPPFTGPGARFDASTVAEYLDNELTAEQVAELEKFCLEPGESQDLYLSEIANCHQILTLYLGEPALVPPTAKQRMYALVKGPEAIPFRKPPAARTPAGVGQVPEEDNTLLPGIPFLPRGSWVRWALPLAGVLLIAALGAALYLASPHPRPHSEQPGTDQGLAAVNDPSKDKGQSHPEPDPNKKPPEQVKPTPDPVTPLPDPMKPKDTNPVKPPDMPPMTDPGPKPETPPGAQKPGSPSTVRAAAATYFTEGKQPSVLVQRQDRSWRRLAPGSAVLSTEPLVSLPGYASEVRAPSGVRLLLRSNLPQFSRHPLMDYLLDSAVTLYQNKDFDLDFQLERGRVYVSNHKTDGPAKVRVRFWGEVWDVTLQEPGTEVGLDLLSHYTRDINYRAGEEPRAELYLCVLKGKASLRIDTFHFNNLAEPPGPAMFLWDNVGQSQPTPLRLEQVPPIWSKQPAPGEGAKEMQLALEELSKQMTDRKQVEIALAEALSAERISHRLLAIYSLCAIDDARKLLDVLADEDPAHVPDRDTAIFALRRWISRSADNHKLLYDGMKHTGLLMEKKYRTSEAEIIETLLHDFNDLDRRKAETFDLLINYLRSDRVAIRELAWWHLMHLTPGVKVPPFNAGLPAEQRELAVKEWKKLLADGKLPPPLPRPMGQPMPMPPDGPKGGVR